MPQQSILCIAEGEFEHISESMLSQGYKVFELDGSRANTPETFFAEVIRQLPLDPLLGGKVHYDALVDSLWYGIDNLQCNKVAIMWKQPSNFATNKPEDFKVIIDCFQQLAEGLASTEYTVGKPVSLTIVLVGVNLDTE